MRKIQFSIITSHEPTVLTKTFKLKPEGLTKISAGSIKSGSVKRIEVHCISDLSKVIQSLGANQVLCFGVPLCVAPGIDQELVATYMLKEHSKAIARTGKFFKWPTTSGVFMIDYDPIPGRPALGKDEFVYIVRKAMPELADVEMLWSESASSNIYNSDTGEMIQGLRGQRLYFAVENAKDIVRLGGILSKRLWLNDYGYIAIGKAGQLLVRSVVDSSVWQPTRIDYASGANCIFPLEQHRDGPTTILGSKKTLDTSTILDLAPGESEQYFGLVAAKKNVLRKLAQEVQTEHIDEKVAEYPPDEQEKIRKMYASVYSTKCLTGDFKIIVLRDGIEKVTSVREILDNPQEYDGLKTLDPFDPDYCNRDDVAYINLTNAKPNLHSFAHGGTTYNLVYEQNAETDTSVNTDRDMYNPNRNTDLGNAERFRDLCSNDIKYVNGRGWLAWDGAKWVEDKTAVVEMYRSNVISRIYSQIAEKAEKHDAIGVKELGRWSKVSESERRIHAAIGLSSTMPGINFPLHEFDKDKYLLNVKNGTVNLKNGKLLEHTRSNRITKFAPVNHSLEATAPIWDAFLDTIFAGDKELISFIQRAIGYSLTGSVEESCWFIAHEVGANGKSVFLNCIMGILGDYATQAAPNLLMKAKSGGDKHPTEQADLLGRRLAVCQETEEGRQLAEAAVKQMTGGDPIKARRMRMDFFEFDPTHKLWLATNHIPIIKDTTESTWRRIYLIRFGVVIPVEERDSKLSEKLKSEWPGILNWAIQGCLEWQRIGLKPPQSVKKSTEEYRDSQDTFAAFIEECCFEDKRAVTTAKKLYKFYKTWCTDAGEFQKSQRLFGQALSERGYTRRRTSAGVVYHGIGCMYGSDGHVSEDFNRLYGEATTEGIDEMLKATSRSRK